VEVLAHSLVAAPWAWLAVVALGAYHGLNPAMGWLLAVSNGMQARHSRAIFAALVPIAVGHLLAIAAALLPFVLLGLYLERLRDVRVASAVALVLFGTWKLVSRRHPRFLARVRPTHLVLWSFLMATAHGAGLMLVPVVLGLCGNAATATTAATAHAQHEALAGLARGDLGIAMNAATAHTVSMVLTGGAIAWLVYRYLGLRLLRQAWVNVDLIWAVLLVAIGGVSLVGAAG
jgi:hypothetical protein